MSCASAASQSSFTRPAAESIRSDEPTFTTMRRKSESIGSLLMLRPPARRAGRDVSMVARLRLLDSLKKRAQHLWHPNSGRGRYNKRRLPRGALQAAHLLLDVV